MEHCKLDKPPGLSADADSVSELRGMMGELTLTEAFGPEDGPQRSDVSMPDASAVAPFGRAFHTDPATLAEVNSEFRAPKRRVVTKKMHLNIVMETTDCWEAPQRAAGDLEEVAIAT